MDDKNRDPLLGIAGRCYSVNHHANSLAKEIRLTLHQRRIELLLISNKNWI